MKVTHRLQVAGELSFSYVRFLTDQWGNRPGEVAEIIHIDNVDLSSLLRHLDGKDVTIMVETREASNGL